MPEVPAVAAKVPEPVQVHLLRSLDRMDADLAELRAEVDRMREHLTRAPHRATPAS